MNLFDCKILSPEKVVFQGKIWQLKAQGVDGAFAIRNKHCDYLSKINEGKIEVAENENKRISFLCKGGLISFKNNSCLIILNSSPEIS
ncbi:MAG TPA: hypothetical protein P5105_03225 [Victivallales bacterium]|nr:hypothetical protein [Victivallales bacterium]HPO89898.1 hypothetical protein [Victivallales bacterium]HRR06271.1 hypothetical protein [Victivallales bacterium]HRR28092.1 hypothetical protein [Victivallales bacterium]HRU01459.1 hypothetical protein [Victivallales bacterium]